MMATYQVSSLPVLTTKNTKQCPQWHTYVERVLWTIDIIVHHNA